MTIRRVDDGPAASGGVGRVRRGPCRPGATERAGAAIDLTEIPLSISTHPSPPALTKAH